MLIDFETELCRKTRKEVEGCERRVRVVHG